ncbi:MAG: hypothetical protein HUJ80_03865 [Firmicutes bacterium]|nr:hypothetical protein [Bacillota bacterium]
MDQDNFLLGSCTYFNDFVSRKTARDIYGFIIDLDGVSYDLCHRLCSQSWADQTGKEIPLPTYVVNSGNGFHLYFLFEEPLPYYKRDSKYINELYRRLVICESNMENIQPDIHWFGQNYRMVGSNNKYGMPNKAYKLGDRWDIQALADYFHIDHQFSGITALMLEKRLSFENLPDRISLSNTGARWYVNRSFYDSVLKQCYTKVREGHRYQSFMALTCIAYKCKVPLEELEKDLQGLVDHYNRLEGEKVLYAEISYALRMYNYNALSTRAVILEEWLGFSFTRYHRHRDAEQRFPRKKTEEMRLEGKLTNMEVYAQKRRDELYPDGSWRKNAGRNSYELLVVNWRQAHPEGTIMECSRDLNIDRKTVSKWWNH